MYYVFWNENSFYVIDKDMNIINRFFTMDEAQQMCFYLNYNYSFYNNPQQEMQAIFPTNTKQNANLLNQQGGTFNSSAPGPGVSYGNITINIPQHESHSKSNEPLINSESSPGISRGMLNSTLRNNFDDMDQNYNNSYLNNQMRNRYDINEVSNKYRNREALNRQLELELEKNASNLEVEKAKKELELQRAKKQLEIEQNASELELEKTKKQIELQKLKKQLEAEKNASNLEMQKISKNFELEQAKKQLELEKNSSNLEIEKVTRALELERANKELEIQQMAKQLEIERMNKTLANNAEENQGSSFISANEITNFIKKLED